MLPSILFLPPSIALFWRGWRGQAVQALAERRGDRDAGEVREVRLIVRRQHLGGAVELPRLRRVTAPQTALEKVSDIDVSLKYSDATR